MFLYECLMEGERLRLVKRMRFVNIFGVDFFSYKVLFGLG